MALDANFGLGWAGMGIASSNLDKQQDAEKYIKEAVRHLDGMTERERYRTRGLYYMLTSDYPSCVKEYGDLINRYSADAPARNNLALCLTHMRQLPRAVEEMRQASMVLMQLVPTEPSEVQKVGTSVGTGAVGTGNRIRNDLQRPGVSLRAA